MKQPFWLALCAIFIPPYALSAIERQPCGALSEPSGVVQLLDGRLLVVEDEKKNPLRLLSLKKDGTVSVQSLNTTQTLADLEAIDSDENGFIYAITSHSLTSKAKRSVAREKLVRFKVEGNQLIELSVMPNLKKAMVALSPSLKAASKVLDVKGNNGFNIEGLSFDRNKEALLIGLRSPVIDKQAVLLVLKNPKAVFEEGEPPQFKNKPIYFDLDKGGIRSITFDSMLNGYLIISRQEKKDKKFKLWFWSGHDNHAPHRVRFKKNFDLSNAEGITAVSHRGEEKLMVVFDVGNSSKRKNGCYAFISYSQLKTKAQLKIKEKMP